MEVVAGHEVVEARPVAGGYTHADRRIVSLADGRVVFVKTATDEETAEWLRAEHHVYAELGGAPFLPELIDWCDDGERPALVLEDLSGCRWPPPWTGRDVGAVKEVLVEIAASRVPSGLPEAADWHPRLHRWPQVAQDPESFLALGLCREAWLEAALPVLESASERASLAGDRLQHFDLRSDNLCVRPDGSVVVVDWNLATVGAAHLDLAFWLPSLEDEGGPAPEAVVGARFPREAALVAGYFAHTAGQPIIPRAPRVRTVQLAQLRSALPWAARANGLPPPR